MSKNPHKRLGAGLRDAEEIKEHPFFRGIDWQEVKMRKLKTVKPEIKPYRPLQIPY